MNRSRKPRLQNLSALVGMTFVLNGTARADISPAGESFGAYANAQISSYYPAAVPFSQNVSISSVNLQNSVPFTSAESNLYWNAPWGVTSSVSNVETNSGVSISNQTTASSTSFCSTTGGGLAYVKGFNFTNASSSSTFAVTSPGVYQLTAICGEQGNQPYDFSSSFSFTGNGSTLVAGTQMGGGSMPALAGQMAAIGNNQYGYTWDTTLVPGEIYTLNVGSASGSDAYGDQLHILASGTVAAVPEPASTAFMGFAAAILRRRTRRAGRTAKPVDSSRSREICRSSCRFGALTTAYPPASDSCSLSGFHE